MSFAHTALIFAGFVVAAPAAAETCELHVWPTEALDAATAGSHMSGLLPALMAGSTTAQLETLGKVLDTRGQIEQLRKMDLVAGFGLPAGTEVVYHEREPFSETRGRAAASQAPCYYDFKVDQILFNRHPIYGKDILAFFSFRQFGSSGDKPILKESGRFRTKMPKFPAIEPANIVEMSGKMNAAFATDVTLFSARVRAKTKPRR